MTPPRLGPDERRTQILDAVLPVVLERGVGVTSKQLAQAAGISEGTIFRSFGDKDTLLQELLRREMCTGLAIDDLERLEYADLADFVTVATHRLVDRFTELFRLVVALGPLAAHPKEESVSDFDDLHARLAALFAAFEDELRTTPDTAAEVLRTLAFAASSSWGATPLYVTRDDVSAVLLHGIATAPTDPVHDGGQRMSAASATLP